MQSSAIHSVKQIRTLLSLVLFVISPTAFADWLHFSTTDEGDKHYVNVASMQTNNHLVNLNFLTNFSKVESKGLRSHRMHQEFNCSNQQMRTLSLSGHSEHFGGGQVLHRQETGTAWVDVPVDTVLYEQFLIACR